MSCDNALYARAGTTWRFQFRVREKVTQVPQSLADLKARLQFRLTTGAATALVTLTEADGLSIEPDGDVGLVTAVLTPAQTRLLAPGNRRTETVYGLELYNDNVSPVDVPWSASGTVVMQPEIARE